MTYTAYEKLDIDERVKTYDLIQKEIDVVMATLKKTSEGLVILKGIREDSLFKLKKSLVDNSFLFHGITSVFFGYLAMLGIREEIIRTSAMRALSVSTSKTIELSSEEALELDVEKNQMHQLLVLLSIKT